MTDKDGNEVTIGDWILYMYYDKYYTAQVEKLTGKTPDEDIEPSDGKESKDEVSSGNGDGKRESPKKRIRFFLIEPMLKFLKCHSREFLKISVKR